MFIKYKLSKKSALFSERFTEIVQSSVDDTNIKKHIKFEIEKLQTEKDIDIFFDEFITCWDEKQFQKLENLIEFILRIDIDPQNKQMVQLYSDEVTRKEIPHILIEIVSIFTPNELDQKNYNEDLLDYVEKGQNIIVNSLRALDFLSYFLPEIANFLIDFEIVEIICANIMTDYSDSARIAAIYLLNDLMRYIDEYQYALYDRVLFKINEYPKFIKFLLNKFLSYKSQPENAQVEDYNLKKFQAVVDLASKIARRSSSKKCASVIEAFRDDIIKIFLFSYETTPECAIEATTGMFYLMRYKPEIIFYSFTENIIKFTIDSDTPEVIYFLLQILKVCNLYLPDDRLIPIYSQIDFNCFNTFMVFNEPLLFATSNFFCTLFERGSQYIQFALENFDYLFEAYQNNSFEIKFSLINAFDFAFINANWQQMSFFFEKDYDLIVFDSIASHESITVCLNAMISITKFDPNRIKDHSELIGELQEIEDAIESKKKKKDIENNDDDDDEINVDDDDFEEEEDEEFVNKQKAMYLISIINQTEE